MDERGNKEIEGILLDWSETEEAADKAGNSPIFHFIASARDLEKIRIP